MVREEFMYLQVTKVSYTVILILSFRVKVKQIITELLEFVNRNNRKTSLVSWPDARKRLAAQRTEGIIR